MKIVLIFSCVALLCASAPGYAQEYDDSVEVINLDESVEMTEPVELVEPVEPVERTKPARPSEPVTGTERTEPQERSAPPSEGTTPLQIAIWPPYAQLFSDQYTVKGMRLGFPVTKSRNAYGIDLAVLGTITGEKNAPGEAKGIQFASAGNHVEGSASAIQLAGIINTVNGWMKGIQFAGLFNEVTEEGSGMQLSALCNFAHKTFTGLQIGAWNEQREATRGMQIGGINYTGSGLQIGVLNFNRRGIFPFMPLCNYGYKEPRKKEAILQHEPVTIDQ
jgi:hypothetical protein